jgi:glycosyltransferase involved in cell wall biosynthesis
MSNNIKKNNIKKNNIKKKNKMKITIVTPNLNGGGAQKVAVNLANYYVSKNYNVDLVILVNSGPYAKLVHDKVNVIHLNAERIRHALIKLRKYLKCNLDRCYLSVMRDSNIAIGLSSIGFELNGLVYREATTLNSLSNFHFFKQFNWYVLLKFTYFKADIVIANSDDTKRDLIDNNIIPSEKVVRIVNPVLPNDFIELANMDITDEWFIEKRYKVILSVGRLVIEKNYKFLIECFSEIYKTNDISRLVIIGEGPEKDNLITLIKDLNLENVIKILNFKNNVYPYFKNAHIFALASDFEGFGNVLVEALSQGTSVVSTDCHGGPKMILDGGIYGKLIPLGDKKLYVEALNFFLTRTDKDAELIKYSLKFSVEFVGEEYLDLLKQCNNIY